MEARPRWQPAFNLPFERQTNSINLTNCDESTAVNHSPSHDDWKPCPPGVVSNLLSRQRSLTRRRWLQRGAWVGLAFVALIPVAVVVSERLSQQDPTLLPRQQDVRLACQEVLALRSDYLAGNISNELRQAIDRHLEHCPYCARRYRDEQN